MSVDNQTEELRDLRGVMSEAVRWLDATALTFRSIGMSIDREPAWVTAARKVRGERPAGAPRCD
jgi:hypothetical protein